MSPEYGLILAFALVGLGGFLMVCFAMWLCSREVDDDQHPPTASSEHESMHTSRRPIRVGRLVAC